MLWLPGDLPEPRPLTADPRLPLDVPFTAEQARDVGVTEWVLRRLVRDGLVRRVLPSVYVDAASADDLTMRARAVSLVLPPDAVVVDEHAAWLHGVDIIPPADQVIPAPLMVFRLPGSTRVRKADCSGGERTLLPDDVEHVHGVPVLTPLRIALDLGRLRTRDRAFVALDAMVGTGRFECGALTNELPRFRGMRGVVQLRELEPMADGGSQSPGEGVLKLRWRDAGLPPCRSQVPVGVGPFASPAAYIDIGNDELRFGAEYDGRDWHHLTDEQRVHDRRRRAWLRRDEGWGIEVFDKDNLLRVEPWVVHRRLRRALEAHLRGHGRNS
jgi:hypothetical protein